MIFRALGIILIFLLSFVLAGCAGKTEIKKEATARTEYNEALHLFKKKNYLMALPAFEKLKESYPLDPCAALAQLRIEMLSPQKNQCRNIFKNLKNGFERLSNKISRPVL